jgi:hypothetical protein
MKITVEIPDDKDIDLDEAVDRLGETAAEIASGNKSEK